MPVTVTVTVRHWTLTSESAAIVMCYSHTPFESSPVLALEASIYSTLGGFKSRTLTAESWRICLVSLPSSPCLSVPLPAIPGAGQQLQPKLYFPRADTT